MAENFRVERGWIIVNGARKDDGHLTLGTGGEVRLSPAEAMHERREDVPMALILKASMQRLAFWRR